MNPTQPQQSTSEVSSTTLSEDTETTQVSGSKGAITEKSCEVPATLAKEVLMDKLQLWDVVSILFPYLQGGWGSAEAHAGHLDLFPSVQLEKGTG